MNARNAINIWKCQECYYIMDDLCRSHSFCPDYCPRCRRNSVWSPGFMGRGQQEEAEEGDG
jgi:hypothetical protein